MTRKPLSYYQSMPEETLRHRIDSIRRRMGSRLRILVHYYQKEEILAIADDVGDSFGLSAAASKSGCEAILFCGVRFMAETADILANANREGDNRVTVVAPNPDAGCRMADMATLAELENAWRLIGEAVGTDGLVPVTYVNSSAEVKAFCGKHGGYACTSSNALAVMRRVFANPDSRVFFLPDQHLGRNVAAWMGFPPEQVVSYHGGNSVVRKNVEHLVADGFLPAGSLEELAPAGALDRGALRAAKVILCDGFCPLHQRFTVAQIDRVRQARPEVSVVVHPECPREVVAAADQAGSTKKILDLVAAAPDGAVWAIGTERRMVEALQRDFPTKTVLPLSDELPMCYSMNTITLASVCRALEGIESGHPDGVVTVEREIAQPALLALERMLQCKG